MKIRTLKQLLASLISWFTKFCNVTKTVTESIETVEISESDDVTVAPTGISSNSSALSANGND